MKKRALAMALALSSSLSVSADGLGPDSVAGPLFGAPTSQPVLNYDVASITTAEWDSPENRHYTYANFDKVHPYPAYISKGLGAPVELDTVENGEELIKSFRIKPWSDLPELNLTDYMYHTRADALLVMKDGKIVFEAYPRQLGPDDQHTMMSSSKTIVAMVIMNLIEEGKLTLKTKIKDIIPELGSAFDGVTIHQALNMDVPMHFSEDYQDPNSEGQRIFVAECWGEGCEKDPRGARGFLADLKSDDPHNNPSNMTHYNSAVTSVLGWVVEELTGMNYNSAVSYYLYKHVGAEHNAIGLNDQTGFGHASGYLAFTARDAAKIYSTIGNDGMAINGNRILPKGYIADVVYGDSEATNYQFGTESTWKYSHQMVFNDKGGFAHMGYGGQIFYSNKDTGVTIIQMSSIDTEGGAVTQNHAHALLDMADKINNLLKHVKL